MKKLLTALCLTIVASVCAFAQNTDEYKKNEFFVGYSNQQVDVGRNQSHNGFEGSYVRNVNRYLGIKADVSGAYRNEEFEFPGVIFIGNGTTTTTTTNVFRSENRNSVYNFLGGVQVRDNASKARLKPFGHALAGVAHYRNKYENSTNNTDFTRFSFYETGFAAAVGGGLDVRLTDRFDIRAIQADYNPIRIGNQWSNNFRFSVGVVFK